MKPLSLIVGIIIVAVIIVGGVMMYRNTQPEEAVLLDNSPLPESETGLDSQFIQQQPVGQPPAAGDLPVSDSTTDADAPADAAGVTISITDTGFVPTTVTVPVGGTVTFVNNGQGSHWPASDVHPTHEILPEFDSKKGLATGERYSYTFTEAGTWQFHDHLRANFKGTIVVE